VKIKLEVTNVDLNVGAIKINSVSSSSVILLGDTEMLKPKSISITRGVVPPEPVIPSSPLGPVGAIL
jgi:hypothetical protein